MRHCSILQTVTSAARTACFDASGVVGASRGLGRLVGLIALGLLIGPGAAAA